MKATIACLLLLLAVAAQAQYFGNYGYGRGGHGRYGRYGGYGVYYPCDSFVRAAAVPAAYPVADGYPAYSASQYHAQDELGQASFGYAHPGQAATNIQDAYGNQVGSYAYFNPDGKEVRVSYTADSRGFRVLFSGLPVAPVANLDAPVPVQDTAEIAQDKAELAAAVTAFNHPSYNYGAAPFAYKFADPATVAASAVPVREATLTKTILTPGHAVAHRVD